jgi:hypothetical protein
MSEGHSAPAIAGISSGFAPLSHTPELLISHALISH